MGDRAIGDRMDIKSEAMTQELSRIGSTLRNVTRYISEEPLPEDIQVLLVLLEWSEPDTGQPSNLPHWTSDRDPEPC